MGKKIPNSLSCRLAPFIGVLLPFLLLLIFLPEPTDSPDVDDYLPSSRVRGVSAQLSKSLKTFSSERAGANGGDVAVNAQARESLYFQTSLLTDAQAQHPSFDLGRLRSARSPPYLSL